MSTQAALAAEISVDLGRSNLTNEITTAIEDAIRHYQTEKFWFCENRSATFVTVASQSSYSSSDDSDIPNFFDVTSVHIEDGTTEYSLMWQPQDVMETLLGNSPASGRPDRYSYFNETFNLYPVPDAVYTIRPIGALVVAAPASEAEADNPWMIAAKELIRAKAKWLLYTHTIKEPQLAAAMETAETRALTNLWAKTSRKRAKGSIRKTRF